MKKKLRKPEGREWVYDKNQTQRRQEWPSPVVDAWSLGRVWSRGSRLGFRRRPKKQGCFRPWDLPSNCLRMTSCCQTFFFGYSPFNQLTHGPANATKPTMSNKSSSLSSNFHYKYLIKYKYKYEYYSNYLS